MRSTYNKPFKWALVIGFFLCVIWSTTTSLAVKLPLPENPLVFYSNSHNQNLKLVLLKALKKAKASILIHSFALSDKDVIKALSKISKKGVKIHIVTDSSTSYNKDLATTCGIVWSSIKISGLMHEKIIVIDDHLSFLGTANMTYESLCMHENMIIGIYDDLLASYLKKHHESMLSHTNSKPSSDRYFFQLDSPKMNLCFLPFPSSEPLQELISLVEEAKITIDIAMFTLTHQKLLDALIKAKNRGVHIKIFLDAQSIKGASKQALKELTSSGIEVLTNRGAQLLHHKLMWIDRHILVIGSANWTKAAFKKNRDFYLVFYDLDDKQINFGNSLIKKLSHVCKKAI